MTRVAILAILVFILGTPGCWDTTIIATEILGGGSPTQPDSDTATGSSASPDSETHTDTEYSTATGMSDGTDSAPRADSRECETTYSGALICTGFEDGITLNAITNEGGSLETVSSPVFEGEVSLHATCEGNEQYANVSGQFDALFEGTIYFRAYFYIPEGAITGSLKLAAFEGDLPDDYVDELNIDFMVGPDRNPFVYLHEPAQMTDSFAAGAVPEGVWFCLRGGVEISDTSGRIIYSVGDEDLLTVTDVDTLSADGISLADFGVGWTGDLTAPVDVYVDNIVVDTSPIPCI